MTDLSPVTALFVYQVPAVVVSVVYAYVAYRTFMVLIDRFAPIVDHWVEHMAEISKTQGEILEALRRFNGKEKGA